jgi:hypothetical protein
MHCLPGSGARPRDIGAISRSARVTHGESVTDTTTVNDADT